MPVGVAVGCCAYYVVTTLADEWQQRGWYNNEMSRLTAAVYQARHSAMERMVADGRAMGAQAVDGARQRELGRAEPGDEPAPPRSPRLFERAQYGIHAREAAGRALGAHRFARDDAMAFEELERDRMRDLRGCGCRVDQRRDE